MSTHNIQFHDKIRKNPLIIRFLELSEEISYGLKNVFELAMVNEPSMFELLWFDCIKKSRV